MNAAIRQSQSFSTLLPAPRRPRILLAVSNRVVRDFLLHTLSKNVDVDFLASDDTQLSPSNPLLSSSADLLLFALRGNSAEDLASIRKVRILAPKLPILLIGATGQETEFLQFVRAGVHGYLPPAASPDDVCRGVRALLSGEAICPGVLCASLFRYFEREATSFPSAALRQRLGLTRREQQIIPLIAEGLTNKEIANRFCLSEQTVKNHLYRMKHKIGAQDRLSIVQVCRSQGFMP